jgi:hypothetical protein
VLIRTGAARTQGAVRTTDAVRTQGAPPTPTDGAVRTNGTGHTAILPVAPIDSSKLWSPTTSAGLESPPVTHTPNNTTIESRTS